MRALLLLPLLCLPLGAQPPSGDPPPEYWLADSAAFWNWDPATFAREAARLGFQWTRENHSARAAPVRADFFGKPAYEGVVRFEEGTPHSVLISYYNRGDAPKPMDEETFKQTVRELMATLTDTLKVSPRPGTDHSRRSTVQDDSRIWQRPNIQFKLAYSFTPSRGGEPFRAEFITLTAEEFSASDIPSHARDRVNPYEVRKNVTRDAPSGEVWIANIPMVDQGPKGYCAAATSERILRFFGQDVDQHQVAQIANTTSGGGTSTEELKSALQAVGRQYGFTLDSHIEWDFKDFLSEMKDYNKQAERDGAAQVSIPTSGVIMIGDIYARVDPETYKKVRLDQRSDYKKFREKITHYVDAGCPLAWSVTLGMFKESTPTGVGGHLRLIIGYNLKKDEVIYSDTWGRGHEKKTMPMEQAYTITKSLFSLEPKGLRL